MDLEPRRTRKRSRLFQQSRQLLLKLRLNGEIPSYVYPDNLIELACEECRARLRKRGVRVKRVLHRFDLSGALIETLTDGEVI